MSNRRPPGFPEPLGLIASAIALGALGLLGGALIFEHILGLPPCPLCLTQRGPLAAAAVLALAAAVSAPLAQEAARIALGAAALVLLIGAGVAVYHSGIELHWWAGPQSCTGGPLLPASAAELAASLSQQRIIRCDTVPWSRFGLSLANYNAFFSAALALAAGLAALKVKT